MGPKHMSEQWNEIKQAARTRWDRLTDQDFERMQEKLDDLQDTIQRRYDYTREQAKAEVEPFLQVYRKRSEEIGEAMTSTANTIGQKTSRIANKAGQTVQQRPWLGVLAGVLIVAVIAFTVSRRFMS